MKVQGHECEQCGRFTPADQVDGQWFDIGRVNRSGASEVCCEECGIKMLRELIAARKAGVTVEEDPQITDNRWTKEEHLSRHNYAAGQTGTCSWCRAEGVPADKRAGEWNRTTTGKPNSEPCWWCGTVFPTMTGHYMHMNRTHGYHKGMKREDVTPEVVEPQDSAPGPVEDDDLMADVRQLAATFRDTGTA